MTESQFARSAGDSGERKPRNKRRYGGKNKNKPSAMERIRARRNNPPRDDDYLDDFDGDTENIEEIGDIEDFDDDVDAWDFEDDEDR